LTLHVEDKLQHFLQFKETMFHSVNQHKYQTWATKQNPILVCYTQRLKLCNTLYNTQTTTHKNKYYQKFLFPKVKSHTSNVLCFICLNRFLINII